MGCLKKVAKLVIFIALIFAFFAYGGYTFIKNKYDAYTNPGREVIVREMSDFGDLSKVSADYQLTRSLNFGGYRKLNALYVPKNQKITIIDLNSDDILTEEDFSSNKIEKKLEELSSKIINSPIIPIENIETTNKGKIIAGLKIVPYIDFVAKVKGIPFLTLRGTAALYTTVNNNEGLIGKIKDKIQKNKVSRTSKLVISTKFSSDYYENITKDFISQIKIDLF